MNRQNEFEIFVTKSKMMATKQYKIKEKEKTSIHKGPRAFATKTYELEAPSMTFKLHLTEFISF